jgi:hypothetical protein
MTYEQLKDAFLEMTEEEQTDHLSRLYWAGKDDLVLELLYEIDDPVQRAHVNPYNRESCGFDEVIDLATAE